MEQMKVKIDELKIKNEYLNSKNKVFLISIPLEEKVNETVYSIQFLEEFRTRKFYSLINLQ